MRKLIYSSRTAVLCERGIKEWGGKRAKDLKGKEIRHVSIFTQIGWQSHVLIVLGYFVLSISWSAVCPDGNKKWVGILGKQYESHANVNAILYSTIQYIWRHFCPCHGIFCLPRTIWSPYYGLMLCVRRQKKRNRKRNLSKSNNRKWHPTYIRITNHDTFSTHDESKPSFNNHGQCHSIDWCDIKLWSRFFLLQPLKLKTWCHFMDVEKSD